MKRQTALLLAGGILFVGGIGCETGVPEEEITVSVANDPLHEPRSILERYAAGQPLGSEVTGYPAIVAHVRESDPARADILEAGLAEIQKASPAARRTKAKELLAKLQPSMNPTDQAGGEAETTDE